MSAGKLSGLGRTIRLGITHAHVRMALDGARQFGAALQSRLRQPVRLIVVRDYDHLLEGVVVGGVDVAWMPPSFHSRAKEVVLATVSERQGEVGYRSAFLVRVDSPCRTVRDLRDARAMWTAPVSASGCVIPRLHLQSIGLDPGALRSEAYAGSPSNAMRSVLDGEADFCACRVREAAGDDHSRVRPDIYRFLPEAAWRLRVLDVTDSIPPDGLVFAPAVDEALQARMRDALLELHEGADGRNALRALLNATRLVPVTPSIADSIDRFRELIAR